MSEQRRFTAVVVDDEPLARSMVGDLLERDPEIQLVGEAGDGKAAIALIHARRPDIAFLDIEMPEAGGLEVARAVDAQSMPAIVFVTAYRSFATEAFERAALDYVVKPFSDRRFEAALGRAKQRVRERRLLGLAERLAAVAAELNEPSARAADQPYLSRIPVQRDGRTRIVDAEQVIWIESHDYYARIHTAERSFLVRKSLNAFESRLDPRRFLRVHRQALVNLRHVIEVEHRMRGALSLRLSNGARCAVSRSRRQAVAERLLAG